MQDITNQKNHTFDSFKDYYQNIRSLVTKDQQGRFVDPFGQIIRSFKTDELGRLNSIYIRPDYGEDYMVLYGSPDTVLNVQGSQGESMYSYVFDRGLLVEERKSDRAGYMQRKYSANSGQNPVFQVAVRHDGPTEEKRWSDDGKTLIRKKIRTMDEDCLEKTITQFVDKQGQSHLRIDYRQYGRYCQTEMYDLSYTGNKLRWLCEKDHKGNYCFYNGQGKLINVVTTKNGKRQRIPVGMPSNQEAR